MTTMTKQGEELTMTTMTDRARELGRERGLAAASWAFDGNTGQETYATFVRAYDDGDPLVLEAFEPGPWLAGELADGPTMRSVAEELGLSVDNEGDAGEVDEACDAYEEAAEAAYWAELERVARYHTQKGA